MQRTELAYIELVEQRLTDSLPMKSSTWSLNWPLSFLYSFQLVSMGTCYLSMIPPSEASFAACIGASSLLSPSFITTVILVPRPLVMLSSSMPILAPRCLTCVLAVRVPK